MHKVVATLMIDGVPQPVLYYEGDSLAKALCAVAQAATRDGDERTSTVDVKLELA